MLFCTGGMHNKVNRRYGATGMSSSSPFESVLNSDDLFQNRADTIRFQETTWIELLWQTTKSSRNELSSSVARLPRSPPPPPHLPLPSYPSPRRYIGPAYRDRRHCPIPCVN